MHSTSSWRAPISITVSSLNENLSTSLDAIQYYRYCSTASPLIREFVSFHIYLPNKDVREPDLFDSNDRFNWPITCENFNRSRLLIDPGPEIFKVHIKSAFSINIARNIARKAANTHFILASDINLIPSVGFVDQFLDMVYLNKNILVLDPDQTSRVYPLPIFEIDKSEPIPKNKAELLSALRRNRAKPYPENNSNRFSKWINFAANDSDKLIVISMTRREREFVTWEPVFVSDNNEPLFDERVTWEGEFNKRLQVVAWGLNQ